MADHLNNHGMLSDWHFNRNTDQRPCRRRASIRQAIYNLGTACSVKPTPQVGGSEIISHALATRALGMFSIDATNSTRAALGAPMSRLKLSSGNLQNVYLKNCRDSWGNA